MSIIVRDVVAAYVQTGDISGLSTAQRIELYLALCAKYRLDPLTRPFDALVLRERTIFYANRGATDQIAFNLGVTRTLVSPPRLLTLGKTEIVHCVASATYNGRTETATGTVPFTDPVNVLMKAESKAKRRATLACVGMGSVLDVTEAIDVTGDNLLHVTPIAETRAILSQTVQAITSDPRFQLPQADESRRAFLRYHVEELTRATGLSREEAVAAISVELRKR